MSTSPVRPVSLAIIPYDANDRNGDPAITLHSPMLIRHNTALALTCDSPVDIVLESGERVVLDTRIAIKISAPSSDLQVSSAKQLGGDFVDGWNKLPEELKLNVLRQSLTHRFEIGWS
jgi:hypothetical protein